MLRLGAALLVALGVTEGVAAGLLSLNALRSRGEAGFWALRFVDLSCLTTAQAETLYVDSVHLSAVGQDRLARHLADPVVADLKNARAHGGRRSRLDRSSPSARVARWTHP